MSENDVIEGDFVVVNVTGKLRTANYIALVDVVDNNDFEGVFLMNIPGKVNSDKLTSFIPNLDDEAFFSREDIICKLPNPETLADLQVILAILYLDEVLTLILVNEEGSLP